jgi:mono/diheme cytochrome c family protein
MRVPGGSNTMNYPIWDVPMLGGGMMIAIVAILHVFVSHFAIGGGLYLVLTERTARRNNDAEMLQFAKRHSTFFILVVLVFGAVSGVGIWWTIALVNPTAVSTLIHVFVWAWAIEWVFFLVELTAAIVYYYGWDRMDAATHLKVGWVYVVSAWLSLLAINGILTFMLTPGMWVETASVADGFFNPTMLPSLVIRTAVCVALAGLYALITGTLLQNPEARARIVRYSVKWVMAGIAVLPLGGLWYVMQLPPMAREISMGGAPVVTLFAAGSILFSGIVVVGAFVGPYLFPKHTHVTYAFGLALMGLMATGVTEWVREAVRKPYIIYDYMYSNTLRVKDLATLSTEGLLANARWEAPTEEEKREPAKLGRRVFRVQCMSCHTVNGFNGMRFAVKGWDRDFLDHQVQYLNELKGFMPPFIGTDEERAGLVEYLLSLNETGPQLAEADQGGS